MNQKNFLKELNLIEQVAFNNRYNPTMIDSMLRRQEKTALNVAYPSISEKKNEYIPMKYFDELININYQFFETIKSCKISLKAMETKLKKIKS